MHVNKVFWNLRYKSSNKDKYERKEILEFVSDFVYALKVVHNDPFGGADLVTEAAPPGWVVAGQQGGGLPQPLNIDTNQAF